MPRTDAFSLAAAHGGAGRLIYDDIAGTAWYVREVDARAIPGARAPRCLVFDAMGASRRVWSYPAAWETLSDAALVAICNGLPATLTP